MFSKFNFLEVVNIEQYELRDYERWRRLISMTDDLFDIYCECIIVFCFLTWNLIVSSLGFADGTFKMEF